MAKVFDVKSALKSGGEETPEWSDKGCKNGHDKNMQVVGRVRECGDVSSQLRDKKFSHGSDDCRRVETNYTSQENPERCPDFPLPPYEHRVGFAHNATPSVHTEVRDRADHVLPPHEKGSPDNTEEHGTKEGTNKTFNSLFR